MFATVSFVSLCWANLTLHCCTLMYHLFDFLFKYIQFGRYLVRVVDESPVQVFSIAMGLSAVVFPLTILNFR